MNHTHGYNNSDVIMTKDMLIYLVNSNIFTWLKHFSEIILHLPLSTFPSKFSA